MIKVWTGILMDMLHSCCIGSNNVSKFGFFSNFSL